MSKIGFGSDGCSYVEMNSGERIDFTIDELDELEGMFKQNYAESVVRNYIISESKYTSKYDDLKEDEIKQVIDMVLNEMDNMFDELYIGEDRIGVIIDDTLKFRRKVLNKL